MAAKSSASLMFAAALAALVVCSMQAERKKRQLMPDQPRIVTNDGHLIFQSGTNHNISFNSGGGVYFDGQDLKVTLNMVKANKQVLDRLTVTGGEGGNVTTRILALEGRVNRLDRATSQFGGLNSSIAALRTQQQQYAANLTQLQSSTQSTAFIQLRLTQLESQFSRINQVVTRIRARTSRTLTRMTARLTSRVTTLETQVSDLRALLTTNECASNPCANGGTCVDMFNSYMCRCPPNFEGSRCDQDVNECMTLVGTSLGCQNGATCQNTHGGFVCQCAANWRGVHCNEQHNDCSGASSRELCGHGVCVNAERVQAGQPRYHCICDPGWEVTTGTGACTTDIDECQTGRHCSVNPPVQCFNTLGSFACGSCPAGYTGDGYSCADIDECLINNGGCFYQAQCVNIAGSSFCGSCPAGFEGNGVTCTAVDQCSRNNGGCHPQATCTNDVGGFSSVRCDCPVGYVGNGRGARGCLLASEAGACNSNPCQNDGTCFPNGNSYRCSCLPGNTGTNCETVINACDSTPCQNGGTCTQEGTGYNCECPSSFTGTNCDQALETCGGRLTGESGTLQYPLPTSTVSRHDRNCAWIITTSFDKIMRIEFQSFNVEYSSSCTMDFLQIHDGRSASAHNIGKYCGTSVPASFNSTTNHLYFWYKTDSSVASQGFTLRWTSHYPTCGGRINSTHGTISSPGYPGNYPNNRDCVWYIAVPPGNIINFQFAALALEHHTSCQYDYLEIRDGETASSNVLNTYCSSQTPVPLQTTGPFAYMRFHTDGSSTDTGFHITFSNISRLASGCGGVINADRSQETGTFTSPGYPQPYQHLAICVWVIKVPQGSKIKLTFSTFNLQSHSSCDYDSVLVRDGEESVSALLGRYCGTSVPAPSISSGTEMLVEMRTDQSISGSGFQATWETTCGGLYQGSRGVITSPNYPQAYNHSKTCGYLIQAESQRTIILTFTNFDLEADSECDYDYVEVYDGASDASPRIGQRYCGETSPNRAHSTSNQLYVKFVTDASVNNMGFRATYTMVEAGCGGVMNTPSGIVRSPGHPSRYSHRILCTWYITVNPGFVIRLTFHTFRLEGNSRRTCYFDYLDVYDNSTIITANRIGRYCGRTTPPVITTTDNAMVLQFRTDGSVSYEGFQASYTSLDPSTMCGRVLTATAGVITSPNYPGNYPHNRECVWTITVPSGNQIELNFTRFALEQHRNCAYDYLEVRNGGEAASPLLGRYCGRRTIEPILSHGNQLYLKFKTDGSRTYQGFRIEYDGASSGCGADLTTPTGSFTSPNYPSRYPHRNECFWTISVSRGSTLALFFLQMDMEGSASGRCVFDYLLVRENDRNGRQIAKICGQSIPNPIIVNTNRLWLKFRTDGSINGNGFRAHYVSYCNANLTGPYGVIESPNFPRPISANQNCTWVVTVPRGNTVNVTFAAFRLNYCYRSRLTIRDGPNPDSPKIGNDFCGTNTPAPFTSTTNKLHIAFVTSSWYSGNHMGFRMEWIANGCGGFLSGLSGVLTSPGYPNDYPHATECVWRITVPTGKRVQLNIEYFHLEHHSTCIYDALEVYAGSDTNSPLLASLCGNHTSPQPASSSGNVMTVRFRSDSSVGMRGFRATFTAIDGGCGGNITGTTHGSLLTPGFPNMAPANTECEWQVRVAEGHSVQLNVTDYNLPYGCSSNYAKIYNGTSTSDPLIGTVCRSYRSPMRSFKSSSNDIFLRYQTIGRNAGNMKAVYKQTCGGYINADEDGVITSPSYPSRFPRRTRCVWVIFSSVNTRRISLTVTNIQIHTFQADCGGGYLALYDGMSESFDRNNTEMHKICGTAIPSTHVSFGSYLTVVFNADARTYGQGFRAVYSSARSTCGGRYSNAPSGEFTSPRYPDPYPMEADCVWEISTSPGNSISLNFPTFQLDPNGGINDDYVEIRSPNVNGQVIGRWFGGTPPGANTTALHGVWIKFRSNEANSGPGFIAAWSSVFGETLTGDSGQVASPLYPNPYPRNLDVTWTIIASQGLRVVLNFDSFQMEGSMPQCRYDYLLIRDGDSQGVQLAKVCGMAVPQPVTASGNVVTLRFVTDRTVATTGYLISWTTISDDGTNTTATPPTIPGCGGALVATNELQNFTSPNYPNEHPHNLNCIWNITTTPGSSIEVNITDMDLEGWSRCYYDYVQFFDGRVRLSRSLGRFCARRRNAQPIQSSNNFMGVHFRADSSNTNSGFVVTYKKACGGTLTTPEGIVSSPGYPTSYPNNQQCVWRIRVRRGKTIRVNFHSTFTLADTSANCSNDYVELRNGFSSWGPPLYLNGSTSNTNGRYCGSSQPPSLETTDNSLLVTFSSDSAGSATGFSLNYTEVSIACGGRYILSNSRRSGFFTSPGYPGNYNHNMDCQYVIIAPVNRRIRIDFEGTFNIERHPSCNYDFLEFHEGATINSPLLSQRLCGNSKPSTFRSVSNVILARFRTDSSAMRAGFKARYSLDSCGGHYAETSGTLSSPNYPSYYPNNQNCQWTIAVQPGHYISMNFTAFSLQSTTNCSSDVVEIRDGNSTGDSLFRQCSRYRNSIIRQTIETSDNTAHILFVSDNANNRQGFQLVFRQSLSVCGGDLSGSSGVIESPNYPSLRTHSRVCTWKITVPEGRKVSLTFTDVDVSSSRYCYPSSITVYNGIIPRSPRLGRFCFSTPQQAIESSGNTMTISLHYRRSPGHRGFRATYSSDNSAECGGLLTSPGNISSPGYPTANYTHGVQCIWHIQNPSSANSSIWIRVLSLDMEYHLNCNYDFLEMRAGSSYDSPLINQICGNRTTMGYAGRRTPWVNFAVPDLNMWLRFKSDASLAGSGFYLHYGFSDCGGMIDASTPGILTSPNYPNAYDHRDACAWKLVAPEGTSIRIRFTNFSMEHHRVCSYDGLTIQNGGLFDSPVFNSYCGDDLPPEFISQSNEVRLSMYTDGSISAPGFQLIYSTDSEACGRAYNALSGSFGSPNSPGSYPHNTFCRWDITTQLGYRVKLDFGAVFDLQMSDDCSNDFVEVRGPLPNGTEGSLGRWCSNQSPPSIVSNSNTLSIIFQSDARTNGHGFTANWTSECGGVFTNEQGIIYSPGYPSSYPHRITCNYTIAPEGNKHIGMIFRDFQLENHRNCRFDSLTAWSGNDTTGNLLGRFCGNSPDTISSRGSLFIQFKADYSLAGRGFKASYYADECGGDLTGPFGSLRTSLYPLNYYHEANCSWTITVGENKIIRFRFSSGFDVEAHSSCVYDYVALYDGPNLNSPMIGKYCGDGSDIPENILSTGNQMYINFVTDSSENGRGFRAYFIETYGPAQGCGGSYRQSSGTITSLDANGDGQYENLLFCQYHIVVDINKVATLNVTDMDLENHSACRYDSLKVYDGTSTDDQLIATYCNQQTGFTTASSNVMLVVFKTDYSVSRGGFNASFSQQDMVCGGAYNVTTQPQTLQSPDFPANTSMPSRCRWYLETGDSSDNIKIQMNTLQLSTTDSTCNSEYVLVYDDPRGEFDQEIRYCGSGPVQIFHSRRNRAAVIYHFTSPTQGGKFQLTYEISDCNRNYTGMSSGRVTSPNHPGDYPVNVECVSRISAPEGTYLSLYFFKFYIEPHRNCQYDYLRIANGNRSQIAQLCGPTRPDPINLPSNEAILTFKTDRSIQHLGYDITYVASPQEGGCGGQLSLVQKGVFTSPGYPGNFTGAASCIWNITPILSQSLFMLLEIQPGTVAAPCSDNYVEVTSQLPSLRWVTQGRYCQSNNILIPNRSPRQVRVTLVTTGAGPAFSFSFSNNRADLPNLSVSSYWHNQGGLRGG